MFQQNAQDTLHPKNPTSPCQTQFLQPESLCRIALNMQFVIQEKLVQKVRYAVSLFLAAMDPWYIKFLRYILVGGFNYFLFSPRKLGKMIQFDEHIFQMGWFNHQLALFSLDAEMMSTTLWVGQIILRISKFLRLFVPQLFLLFLAVFHHSVSPSFSGIPYIWLLAQSLARFDLLHFDTIAFCRYESSYDPVKSLQSLTWINHLTFHQIQWLLPRLENPWGVALQLLFSSDTDVVSHGMCLGYSYGLTVASWAYEQVELERRQASICGSGMVGKLKYWTKNYKVLHRKQLQSPKFYMCFCWYFSRSNVHLKFHLKFHILSYPVIYDFVKQVVNI